MGKYSSYVRDLSREEKKKKEIHPVWRGIGFLIIVIVPILSYFFMNWVLIENQTRHWFPLPADILLPWGSDPFLLIKIVIMLIFVAGVLAVLTLFRFLYSLIFGPPRYGPHDSPPIKPETQPRRSR